jgi:NAD-dependent SIR2 family protein deacetylase
MSMTPSRRVVESLTIADIAIDGRLFVVRCNYCRRTTYFLASDLAKFYGEKKLVKDLFNRCSKCGQFEFMHVSHRFPDFDDDGALTIRRPRQIWQWKDEIYWKDGKPPNIGKDAKIRTKES